MFQTLQPHNTRLNKTAGSGQRRKLYFTDETIRPHTVGFDNFQNSNFAQNYKTLDLAELQLNRSFKKEMNPYIKEKIKQLNHKNQRKIYYTRPLSHTIENPQVSFSFNNSFHSTMNSPMNVKQMKICSILNRVSQSPVKSQDVIDEGLITNTKQRISRLISMKKQQQQRFVSLNRCIKSKCSNSKNIHLRRRSMIEPKQHVQSQIWDLQWKEQTKKQCNRYRNRLLARHKRQNSIKIKLDNNNFN